MHVSIFFQIVMMIMCERETKRKSKCTKMKMVSNLRRKSISSELAGRCVCVCVGGGGGDICLHAFLQNFDYHS